MSGVSDVPADRSLVDDRPLVLHVVYRFDVGGLENGVVNLINHMPVGAFRHAIVSLTDITAFSQRVRRENIDLIALHKLPGHGLWLYARLFRLFRAYRPAIVHTRNLAAMETVVPAWLAGVPVRLHGEHGRDVSDLDGSSRRHQWIRRLYRPFITHYVALSRDLAEYLVEKVGVPRRRIAQIYNGVDVSRFRPLAERPTTVGSPFDPRRHWIVGTVGRMQVVKDQSCLARAFVRALELRPTWRDRLRLVMIGEGPLRSECQAILQDAGVADLAWLPGERRDVDDVLRGLHCFVLPSLAEGISNTILEAMATGLPVLATDVGGNADLVAEGETGELVPVANIEAMAQAIVRLAADPERAARMGRAGRARVEARFSMHEMVSAYQRLYEGQLGRVADYARKR